MLLAGAGSGMQLVKLCCAAGAAGMAVQPHSCGSRLPARGREQPLGQSRDACAGRGSVCIPLPNPAPSTASRWGSALKFLGISRKQ